MEVLSRDVLPVGVRRPWSWRDGRLSAILMGELMAGMALGMLWPLLTTPPPPVPQTAFTAVRVPAPLLPAGPTPVPVPVVVPRHAPRNPFGAPAGIDTSLQQPVEAPAPATATLPGGPAPDDAAPAPALPPVASTPQGARDATLPLPPPPAAPALPRPAPDVIYN